MQKSKEINPTPHFTETEIDIALDRAKKLQLPLLIDFWAPNCKGCKKMDDTTYKDISIIQYIENNFVFVKFNVLGMISATSVSSVRLSPVLWTPGFVILSNDGNEVKKMSGYLSSLQFHDEMEIGRALSLLRKSNPAFSLKILESLISTTSNTNTKPEALYWAGVASYFLNQRSADSLTFHWNKLLTQFPESIWAEKADCLNINV